MAKKSANIQWVRYKNYAGHIAYMILRDGKLLPEKFPHIVKNNDRDWYYMSGHMKFSHFNTLSEAKSRYLRDYII